MTCQYGSMDINGALVHGLVGLHWSLLPHLHIDMLVAATFVLFTALLVSADGSPPLKLVTRSAKITDGGKRMISKGEKVLSNAFRSTKPLEYADCSAEQEKEIASAVKEAQAYASAAHQYLRSNPKGTILYTQWFGTFESAIYDKVIKSASVSSSSSALKLYSLIYSKTGTQQVAQHGDINANQVALTINT
ncbi:hypothetical protein RSAG8_03972, partial [Rhizoctonia solani AG-8 WAC10335]